MCRSSSTTRKVEHHLSPRPGNIASVKKSIYSLINLREILLGCHRRYIAHLSALDDFSAGIRALARLCSIREVDSRTAQGINFFGSVDSALVATPCRTRASTSFATRHSPRATCCRQIWRAELADADCRNQCAGAPASFAICQTYTPPGTCR